MPDGIRNPRTTRHRFMESKSPIIVWAIWIAAPSIAACLAATFNAARAQDVPGIEICTRESRLDRRTSCLQSNVEFLQQEISRNALDAQQKLGTAARDIAALKDMLAAARADIAALRESLAAAQAKIDEMQKAPPAAPTAWTTPAAPTTGTTPPASPAAKPPANSATQPPARPQAR
jgi:septal ring factor EnvC (AmiA/AmiB activator)